MGEARVNEAGTAFQVAGRPISKILGIPWALRVALLEGTGLVEIEGESAGEDGFDIKI